MKKNVILLGVALALVLGGCGADVSNESGQTDPTADTSQSESHNNMDHSQMNHSSSGEVPAGIKEAADPTYKVGSEAVIQDDHMGGMKGATATIAGAYDTTAYVITYTPTTGGEPVEHHKWVIQEEIKDAGDQALEPGTEVVIQADHMPGMNGTSAMIESAEATTVYMVDYTPTTGGEPVINHKWVTESELSAK